MKWIWFHEKNFYEDFDAYARSWMTWISWRLTLQRGGTDNFSNNFLKKILSDKNVLRKDNLLIMKKQHYISQILSASFSHHAAPLTLCSAWIQNIDWDSAKFKHKFQLEAITCHPLLSCQAQALLKLNFQDSNWPRIDPSITTCT